MTLEELWELFPVVLAAHDLRWREWAVEEIGALEALLKEFSPVINHIGSTAVAGIMAKPVVDLLVEVPRNSDWGRIRDIMEKNGYICMADSPRRMSFNKGYTPEGYAERVFHIHFHTAGDRDEVLFRDYLRTHPAEAREYERLKLVLAERFRHDRDAYTEAKTEFIRGIMNKLPEPDVSMDIQN